MLEVGRFPAQAVFIFREPSRGIGLYAGGCKRLEYAVGVHGHFLQTVGVGYPSHHPGGRLGGHGLPEEIHVCGEPGPFVKIRDIGGVGGEETKQTVVLPTLRCGYLQPVRVSGELVAELIHGHHHTWHIGGFGPYPPLFQELRARHGHLLSEIHLLRHAGGVERAPVIACGSLHLCDKLHERLPSRSQRPFCGRFGKLFPKGCHFMLGGEEAGAVARHIVYKDRL